MRCKKQHFAIDKLENISLCGIELIATSAEFDLDEEKLISVNCKKCIKEAKKHGKEN